MSDISCAEEGVVKTVNEEPHGLSTGMFVQFREVKGMEELNGEKSFEVKSINKDSFSIGNTSSFSKYISGGVATQVKMPITRSFVKNFFFFLFIYFF